MKKSFKRNSPNIYLPENIRVTLDIRLSDLERTTGYKIPLSAYIQKAISEKLISEGYIIPDIPREKPGRKTQEPIIGKPIIPGTGTS